MGSLENFLSTEIKEFAPINEKVYMMNLQGNSGQIDCEVELDKNKK